MFGQLRDSSNVAPCPCTFAAMADELQVIPACDVYRYERLGAVGYHRNCTDNLAQALRAAGLDVACTPCPLNLWENSRVQPDGTQVIAPPVSAPGDYVVLRAELDLLIVFSACPQDMVPTNGAEARPADAHFVVLP